MHSSSMRPRRRHPRAPPWASGWCRRRTTWRAYASSRCRRAPAGSRPRTSPPAASATVITPTEQARRDLDRRARRRARTASAYAGTQPLEAPADAARRTAPRPVRVRGGMASLRLSATGEPPSGPEDPAVRRANLGTSLFPRLFARFRLAAVLGIDRGLRDARRRAGVPAARPAARPRDRRHQAALDRTAAAMIVIAIITGVLGVLSRRCSQNQVGRRVVHDLRTQPFPRHLQRLSLEHSSPARARRGAVAHLERHRRRPERRHEHGGRALERDDGDRDDDRRGSRRSAALTARVRARAGLVSGVSAPSGREIIRLADVLEPRPGVYCSLRGGPRQDDEPDAQDWPDPVRVGVAAALGAGDPAAPWRAAG